MISEGIAMSITGEFIRIVSETNAIGTGEIAGMTAGIAETIVAMTAGTVETIAAMTVGIAGTTVGVTMVIEALVDI
ncbi:MAG: hypothetical protein ACP5R6_03570 [Chlorobaculum sp.]